jgi:hypothetical protein
VLWGAVKNWCRGRCNERLHDKMHFETVFDVAQAGYKNWWFPACGLILVAVGALLVFFPRVATIIFTFGLGRQPGRGFAWTYFIFSLVWTVATFALTLGDYIAARNALISGRANVVEGVVTDFRPMPYEGHARESFVVAGKEFSYSDFGVTAGFNNTRSHGGPIDKGVYVRVTHRGNTILRLEIAR